MCVLVTISQRCSMWISCGILTCLYLLKQSFVVVISGSCMMSNMVGVTVCFYCCLWCNHLHDVTEWDWLSGCRIPSQLKTCWRIQWPKLRWTATMESKSVAFVWLAESCMVHLRWKNKTVLFDTIKVSSIKKKKLLKKKKKTPGGQSVPRAASVETNMSLGTLIKFLLIRRSLRFFQKCTM